MTFSNLLTYKVGLWYSNFLWLPPMYAHSLTYSDKVSSVTKLCKGNLLRDSLCPYPSEWGTNGPKILGPTYAQCLYCLTQSDKICHGSPLVGSCFYGQPCPHNPSAVKIESPQFWGPHMHTHTVWQSQLIVWWPNNIRGTLQGPIWSRPKGWAPGVKKEHTVWPRMMNF